MGYNLEEELLNYLFQVVDHDHGDKITFKEFFSWWCSPDKATFITFYHKNPEWALYAVDLFKYYDKDRTGELEHKEFEEMFTEFSESPHEVLKSVWEKNKDISSVIKAIDKKGSGKIDFDEFFSWLHWTV